MFKIPVSVVEALSLSFVDLLVVASKTLLVHVLY